MQAIRIKCHRRISNAYHLMHKLVKDISINHPKILSYMMLLVFEKSLLRRIDNISDKNGILTNLMLHPVTEIRLESETL